MVEYKEILNCRSCGSQYIEKILSLGEIAISTFSDEPTDGEKAPLELVSCKDCSLVQLRHTVPQERLYRNYWYRSFTNDTMRRHLQEIVFDAMGRVNLDIGDIVIDIGSNDGTLLGFYPWWVTKVGFEPAAHLARDAREDGVNVIPDFFRLDWFKYKYPNRKAKIISSIAMFYDLDEPNSFVREIKECLDKNGIWIVEMLDLRKMLMNNAFDAICAEHLEYYDLNSFRNLLSRHGLKVIELSYNDINGGSLRAVVAYDGRDVDYPMPNVSMKRFGRDIKVISDNVRSFLSQVQSQKKIVYGYGASTKGNTFLQYAKIDNTLLPKIADRNPQKWGKYTVSSKIPIISEEAARDHNPDYFLVLIWQFRDAVIKREMDYLKGGGKLIFALPRPEIVEYDQVKSGIAVSSI